MAKILIRVERAYFAKEKKQDPNYVGAGGLALTSAYVGQQTIRSGVPRALGVRLESHSTGNKSANDILENGGYLDPNKSGTAATRGLEAGQGRVGTTNINDAKNKVYITGVRPDSIARIRVSPFNANKVMVVDPKNQNVLHQLIERKLRRQSYRSQSYLDWDKINTAGDYKQVQIAKNQARAQEMLKAQIMPWRGRSLYIGGSDKYFLENFKPDFDDPGAQYTDKKIKVYGNRLAATTAAIEREGLGNLMAANKGRVAAGAAILAGGGLAAAALAAKALELGQVNVGGHVRASKSGKLSMVRGFERKQKVLADK